MKRSAYLLVSLFALSAGSLAAEESDDGTDVYPNEEVAALKRRTKGLNVASNAKDRATTLEQKMNEVYTDTVRDTFGAKAASARPQLDSYNLYLSGDVIYWKVYEGGGDYATTTQEPIPYVAGKSRTNRLDFNWRWGFKTELGYRTPHDGWDLAAHYTWFRDQAIGHVQAGTGEGLTPLLPNYYTNDALIGSAYWWLHFSDLDLTLQKSYFLSHSFSLSPIAALRTTWIKQNLTAHYYFPIVSQAGKNDFWGIGPKAGVSTRWFVDSHWNFFGNCSGSLLYSSFDVRATTVVNTVTTTSLNGTHHRIVPTVQGAIGFGWEANFLSNHYHVAMNIAYEAQYWWRQNQLFNYTNIAEPVLKRYGEDLGLHGLTINALFDF